MTAHKELAEEAAAVLRNYGYGHLADVVEAVFEKAHTPTDDEREALDYAIRCAIPNDLDYRPLWKMIRAIQDAVLAAGFRRSEVPEPQGEPSDVQVEAALEAFAHRDGAHANREDMRAALRAAGGVR